MAKRKFNLTEAERKELLRAYRTCEDAAIRTRYQAVRLYGEGYPVDKVMQITGCSRPSLMEWCRAYREDQQTALGWWSLTASIWSRSNRSLRCLLPQPQGKKVSTTHPSNGSRLG